jgi:hypothetical protein
MGNEIMNAIKEVNKAEIIIPTHKFMFVWVAIIPEQYAPIQKNPACPSEIWPAYPNKRLRLKDSIE